MKQLILLILFLTCTQTFAVTTFTRKDGSIGLRYHHKLKIEGETYYCNKDGDCRTYVDWVNNETPQSRKHFKVLAGLAERKAINKATGSSEEQKKIVWLTQEEWKKNRASCDGWKNRGDNPILCRWRY